MTLIGAFNCIGGVVLFADRQETIENYAKWDTPKIYQWELQGEFRFLMAAAGESDPINMIWAELLKDLRNAKLVDLKASIIRVINRVTRKCIFPLPKDDRPVLDIIVAIQPISYAARNIVFPIDLFRVTRLYVNPINHYYFTGNPILLTQFLNDQYLKGHIITLDEAEALATYLLWEAKEYDTFCGKYSDVFILKIDGGIGRLMPAELEYWEEHWRQYKNSLRFLPVISCTSEPEERLHNVENRLGQFLVMMRTLSKEQLKMRKKNLIKRNSLEEKLIRSLQRESRRQLKALERKEARRLASGKSKLAK
jgi:hypothetical protein